MARGKRKSTATSRSRGAKTSGTKRKLQEQQQQQLEDETVVAAVEVERNENDRKALDSEEEEEEEHQAKRIKSKEFMSEGDLIRLCLDRIVSSSSSSSSSVRYDASFSERIWHEMTTNHEMTKRLNQYGVLERYVKCSALQQQLNVCVNVFLNLASLS